MKVLRTEPTNAVMAHGADVACDFASAMDQLKSAWNETDAGSSDDDQALVQVGRTLNHWMDSRIHPYFPASSQLKVPNRVLWIFLIIANRLYDNTHRIEF
jgi:hypothetical protein